MERGLIPPVATEILTVLELPHWLVWPSPHLHFLCNGRFSGGPRGQWCATVSTFLTTMGFIALPLIVVATLFFAAVSDAMAMLLWVPLLYVVSYATCFVVTSLVDPGYIPHGEHDLDGFLTRINSRRRAEHERAALLEQRKRASGAMGASSSSSSSSLASSLSSSPLTTSPPTPLPKYEDLERWRYCKLCDVNRPAGAMHCGHCGHCVLGLDHHCPIFGTCIAARNINWFYATLFYGHVGTWILIGAFALGVFRLIVTPLSQLGLLRVFPWRAAVGRVLPRVVTQLRNASSVDADATFYPLLPLTPTSTAVMLGVALDGVIATAATGAALLWLWITLLQGAKQFYSFDSLGCLKRLARVACDKCDAMRAMQSDVKTIAVTNLVDLRSVVNPTSVYSSVTVAAFADEEDVGLGVEEREGGSDGSGADDEWEEAAEAGKAAGGKAADGSAAGGNNAEEMTEEMAPTYSETGDGSADSLPPSPSSTAAAPGGAASVRRRKGGSAVPSPPHANALGDTAGRKRATARRKLKAARGRVLSDNASLVVGAGAGAAAAARTTGVAKKRSGKKETYIPREALSCRRHCCCGFTALGGPLGMVRGGRFKQLSHRLASLGSQLCVVVYRVERCLRRTTRCWEHCDDGVDSYTVAGHSRRSNFFTSPIPSPLSSSNDLALVAAEAEANEAAAAARGQRSSWKESDAGVGEDAGERHHCMCLPVDAPARRKVHRGRITAADIGCGASVPRTFIAPWNMVRIAVDGDVAVTLLKRWAKRTDVTVLGEWPEPEALSLCRQTTPATLKVGRACSLRLRGTGLT